MDCSPWRWQLGFLVDRLSPLDDDALQGAFRFPNWKIWCGIIWCNIIPTVITLIIITCCFIWLNELYQKSYPKMSNVSCCFCLIDPNHKSQNASVAYPTMQHFVTEMWTCVHISVQKCLSDALLDLWDGFIMICVLTKRSHRNQLVKSSVNWILNYTTCNKNVYHFWLDNIVIMWVYISMFAASY